MLIESIERRDLDILVLAGVQLASCFKRSNSADHASTTRSRPQLGEVACMKSVLNCTFE